MTIVISVTLSMARWVPLRIRTTPSGHTHRSDYKPPAAETILQPTPHRGAAQSSVAPIWLLSPSCIKTETGYLIGAGYPQNLHHVGQSILRARKRADRPLLGKRNETAASDLAA
jgi:hypothetical protein